MPDASRSQHPILLARPSLARKSLQDGGEEIYRNGTEGSNPACSSTESSELLLLDRPQDTGSEMRMMGGDVDRN
jgi:hypothetical protein